MGDQSFTQIVNRYNKCCPNEKGDEPTCTEQKNQTWQDSFPLLPIFREHPLPTSWVGEEMQQNFKGS